ncbi:hypothetical protein B7494_g1175 [Chlorociboria aeruginascens]|nr:hypothetical protein B7494_g1175 [Chlorociboria aeruginascens]
MDGTEATTAPSGTPRGDTIVSPENTRKLLLHDLPQTVQSRIIDYLGIGYQDLIIEDPTWALSEHLQEALIEALKPLDSSTDAALKIVAEKWTFRYYEGFEETPEYVIWTMRHIHFDIGLDRIFRENIGLVEETLQMAYEMQTVSITITNFSVSSTLNMDLLHQFVRLLTCFRHLLEVHLHLVMESSRSHLELVESMRKRINNRIQVEAKRGELPRNRRRSGYTEEKWVWKAEPGSFMDWPEETAEIAIDAMNKMIDSIFKTAEIFSRTLHLVKK